MSIKCWIITVITNYWFFVSSIRGTHSEGSISVIAWQSTDGMPDQQSGLFLYDEDVSNPTGKR